MKKLFIYSLTILALSSCSKESTSIEENLFEENKIEERSYIIDGEKKTIKVDITDIKNPAIIETDESKLILSILNRDDEVYYINPEIENTVLFKNEDSFNLFIGNIEKIKTLKNKFKSKIAMDTESKNSVSKSVTNTPSVTIYKNSNFSGSSFSFLNQNSLFYYNPRLHTDISQTGGVDFNDRISSLKVAYAYAEFYEGSPYKHEKIVIDSYNYCCSNIYNLKDIRLKNLTLVDDNGIPSGNVKTAFWQRSFNDKITSLRARADGGRW